MTLKDCYAQLGGDYTGVLSRLMKDTSVSRFIQMMLKDTQLAELKDALEKNDYEVAFRAVHTIKGTSLNLGISKLAQTASILTEELRNGAPVKDISSMVTDLEAEYKRTMDIIRAYSENPEV